MYLKITYTYKYKFNLKLFLNHLTFHKTSISCFLFNIVFLLCIYLLLHTVLVYYII